MKTLSILELNHDVVGRLTEILSMCDDRELAGTLALMLASVVDNLIKSINDNKYSEKVAMQCALKITNIFEDLDND